MKFIHDNIRKFRTEIDMSREDLAKEIIKNGKTITSRTIQNFEEAITTPDADLIAIMAQIFKKPVGLFFAPVTYQNGLDNDAVSESGR